MLKSFLVVALAILTLASCSKDNNDTPAYSLYAKIDGSSQAFNTSLYARRSGGASTGYDVSIVGGAGSTSAPYPTLSLYVTSADPIVAKTYTATALEAGSFYFVDASTNFISDVDFTVNITSISDTDIKGTFSGKVGQGSAAKTVSEGVFSAKFY